MQYPRPPSQLPKYLATLLLVTPIAASAYIDPNAGGILYQIIFPVLVAVGAIWAGMKHWIVAAWHKFIAILKRHIAGPSKTKQDPPE